MDRDRTVVVLTGEIDADLTTGLQQATIGAQVPELPIEVDMREVTFMDSSGLGFLAGMARISAGRVRVVGAPDVVRALLEVTQVSRLVDLVGEPAASQAGNPWLSPGEAGSISTTEELDATVIHLRGEIDASLRAQAGAVIAQVLDRRLPVILDTGEVTFIDSTGMAFLIQCCTISHQEGLRVTLPDPPAAVTSVVDALAINDLFDLSAERPVDSTD